MVMMASIMLMVLGDAGEQNPSNGDDCGNAGKDEAEDVAFGDTGNENNCGEGDDDDDTDIDGHGADDNDDDDNLVWIKSDHHSDDFPSDSHNHDGHSGDCSYDNYDGHSCDYSYDNLL